MMDVQRHPKIAGETPCARMHDLRTFIHERNQVVEYNTSTDAFVSAVTHRIQGRHDETAAITIVHRSRLSTVLHSPLRARVDLRCTIDVVETVSGL